MEQDYLTSELRALGIQIEFLTKAVARLEEQNENRRNSIDAFAQAIRAEYQGHQQQCNQDFENVKRDIDKIKVEATGVRWLLGSIGITVVAYLTTQFLKPEPFYDPNLRQQTTKQALLCGVDRDSNSSGKTGVFRRGTG